MFNVPILNSDFYKSVKRLIDIFNRKNWWIILTVTLCFGNVLSILLITPGLHHVGWSELGLPDIRSC